MERLKESLLKGLGDRFIALVYAKNQEPTYTTDGDLGKVIKTNIFTGTIKFESLSGQTRKLPGHMIGEPNSQINN